MCICSPDSTSSIYITVFVVLYCIICSLHFMMFVLPCPVNASCPYSLFMSVSSPPCSSASWPAKDCTPYLHKQSWALAAAERKRGVCGASQAHPHSPPGQEAEQERDPAACHEVHQLPLQPPGGPGRREECWQHNWWGNRAAGRGPWGGPAGWTTSGHSGRPGQGRSLRDNVTRLQLWKPAWWRCRGQSRELYGGPGLTSSSKDSYGFTRAPSSSSC